MEDTTWDFRIEISSSKLDSFILDCSFIWAQESEVWCKTDAEVHYTTLHFKHQLGKFNGGGGVLGRVHFSHF